MNPGRPGSCISAFVGAAVGTRCTSDGKVVNCNTYHYMFIHVLFFGLGLL